MNNAEEHQLSILTSRVNRAEREKQEAQRQARIWEEQCNAKDARIAELEHQLSSKVNELSESIRQLAQLIITNPLSLSDSIIEPILSEIRKEFEARSRAKDAAHAQELQELKFQMAQQLTAKDKEIAKLKTGCSEE